MALSCIFLSGKASSARKRPRVTAYILLSLKIWKNLSEAVVGNRLGSYCATAEIKLSHHIYSQWRRSSLFLSFCLPCVLIAERWFGVVSWVCGSVWRLGPPLTNRFGMFCRTFHFSFVFVFLVCSLQSPSKNLCAVEKR